MEASFASERVVRSAQSVAEQKIASARETSSKLYAAAQAKFREIAVPAATDVQAAERERDLALEMVAMLEEQISTAPKVLGRFDSKEIKQLKELLVMARQQQEMAERTLAQVSAKGVIELAAAERVLADGDAAASAVVVEAQKEAEAQLLEAQLAAAAMRSAAATLVKALLVESAELKMKAAMLLE